jgi:hypothetical protein
MAAAAVHRDAPEFALSMLEGLSRAPRFTTALMFLSAPQRAGARGPAREHAYTHTHAHKFPHYTHSQTHTHTLTHICTHTISRARTHAHVHTQGSRAMVHV